MEFDVFGTRMVVERTPSGWALFYPAEEGKRRTVPGLLIPPDTAPADIPQYLADLCHEAASPAHPDVRRLR